jgi:GntR family histidine utilization transcriptional repressor
MAADRQESNVAIEDDPSAISLHQRILGDIEANILSGAWERGHRLPTEMELAATYSCSRMTVNKVLSQLTKAGLIERRRRAGSFVLRPRSQAAVLEIHEIRTEVEALGRHYGYRLLQRTVRPVTGNDRHWLGEEAPGPILEISALHLAGGQPFCLEERSINLAAVPEAEQVDFATQPSSSWLLDRVPWTTAEHEIRATGATTWVAETFAVPEGTPCLVVARKTWNADHPVTSVRLTYIGESHSLVARFTPNQG